jgi:hypothetical protein
VSVVVLDCPSCGSYALSTRMREHQGSVECARRARVRQLVAEGWILLAPLGQSIQNAAADLQLVRLGPAGDRGNATRYDLAYWAPAWIGVLENTIEQDRRARGGWRYDVAKAWLSKGPDHPDVQRILVAHALRGGRGG